MARRQQKVRPQDILALIAVLFLAYVAPFVILIAWVITEYRAKNVGADPSQEVQRLLHELDLAQERIDRIWQDGQDRGLPLRRDNMFNERSTGGRAFNSAIHKEQDKVQDLQSSIAAITAPMAQRDAMRGAAIAWVTVFLLLWMRQPDPLWFWKSVWASVAAIVVAIGTYLVRKAAYEAPGNA